MHTAATPDADPTPSRASGAPGGIAQAGRGTARIVCHGELLLRLSAPGRERLLQSSALQVHVGGAEANVAVALAQLGHRVDYVGAVADNALGGAALGELRRHGVSVDGALRRPGRMGLYFLAPGAGMRPSEVLYDRAGSAFAQTGSADYDWAQRLQGAALLHVSGVTPALGTTTAESAIDAACAARAAGAMVSFDGNFRARLWSAWDSDPPAILRRLIAEADLAFADHRDIDVVLGADAAGDAQPTHEARFAAAAARAFAAFPHLRRVAATVRVQHSVDSHTLGALMALRDGTLHRAEPMRVDGIVDRIGAGDAFAAGVLHGLIEGMDDAGALRFGLAAGCLKHSIPGDFNLSGADEIHALLRSDALDVRR